MSTNLPSSNLCQLPEDLLFAILLQVGAEGLLAIESTSKSLRSFVRYSRALWSAALLLLGHRLPLPLPVSFLEQNATISQCRLAIRKALRLETVFDSNTSAAPRTRSLKFSHSRHPLRVVMLRILPGAKQILIGTDRGRILCWDVGTCKFMGEWQHGGAKINSMDADVATNELGRPFTAMAVSLEHRNSPQNHDGFTHRLHVVRLDTHIVPGCPLATFTNISETSLGIPLHIVSLEGDFAAAYTCNFETRPAENLAVLLVNWKKQTAVKVSIPPGTISLYNLATLQILGDHVLLFEDRSGTSPAMCAFKIPQNMAAISKSTPPPEILIKPSLAFNGLGGLNVLRHQSRFSKKWRSYPQECDPKLRRLSVLIVTKDDNNTKEDTVKLFDFQSGLGPALLQAPAPTNTAPCSDWTRRRPDIIVALGARCACLGRYGHKPLWIENSEEGLQLMGISSPESVPHQVRLSPSVDLSKSRYFDWDDAEGLLCILHDDGIWVMSFV